jgi:mannose-6-phosphate isomerase class I
MLSSRSGQGRRRDVSARAAAFTPLAHGLVLFEIQQNSDTTYRVFDWNRVGLDGKPRELHIAQSLASIDFTDYEPKLAESKFITDRKNPEAPSG